LLQRADSLYVAAGRLDPEWTMPTIGRGWVSLQLSLVAPSSMPASDASATRDAARRAISFANAALARPGQPAKALALRGYALQWLGTLGDVAAPDSILRQSEADLRAALDERPDDARSWYALGEVLSANGRFAEAREALGRAYEADAYLTEARAVVNLLFFVSLNSEQFEEAQRWCTLGQKRYSDGPEFVTCPLIQLGWTGRSAADVSTAWEHVAALERGPFAPALASQWGFFRLMTAAIAARAGLTDSARSIVAAVRSGVANNQSRDPALDVDAYVQLLLGERDSAARLLRELLKLKPQERAHLERSPWFKDLFADVRYRAILDQR
jgi:tetratricopeptide (TPR) repeat protein